MRCTHCGSIVPPGLLRCPICNTMLDSAQAQEDYRSYQPYPKMNEPQIVPPAQNGQSLQPEEHQGQPRQYATPAFHTYRQQRFTGPTQPASPVFEAQPRDTFSPGGRFSKALSDLPQVLKGAFTDPAGTLDGMVRRDDRVTGGVIVLLSVVFAFLAGMILVKGALGSLLAVTSGMTGLQWADNAASLNQGVTYLAGKVGVPVGGVAAVCQLIIVLMPVAVTMVYLSVIRQVRFSFTLLSGLAAILTLPNLLALILASVSSLLSPYISAVVLLLGQVVSYVLLCAIVLRLAAIETDRAVVTQSALIGLSILTTLVLTAVLGGAMLGGVIRTLTSLTNSMGGLL